jgi:hypothetical protein
VADEDEFFGPEQETSLSPLTGAKVVSAIAKSCWTMLSFLSDFRAQIAPIDNPMPFLVTEKQEGSRRRKLVALETTSAMKTPRFFP